MDPQCIAELYPIDTVFLQKTISVEDQRNCRVVGICLTKEGGGEFIFQTLKRGGSFFSYIPGKHL